MGMVLFTSESSHVHYILVILANTAQTVFNHKAAVNQLIVGRLPFVGGSEKHIFNMALKWH